MRRCSGSVRPEGIASHLDALTHGRDISPGPKENRVFVRRQRAFDAVVALLIDTLRGAIVPGMMRLDGMMVMMAAKTGWARMRCVLRAPAAPSCLTRDIDVVLKLEPPFSTLEKF